MFLGDLALELKMSVSELAYGRGTPMSAHELVVFWPTYFEFRHREAKRQEEKQKQGGRR
jgi:hypothetical protein